MSTIHDDILTCARDWRSAGKGVALATVVRTWGSSPRPVGSHLAVNNAGEFVGSVSGGCVEGAVITEAGAVIADGKPRLLEFGVSDEQAWEVGLACGGQIHVYLESLAAAAWLDTLGAARTARRAAALVTRLGDGAKCYWEEGRFSGDLVLPAAAQQEVAQRIVANRSGALEADDGLFVRIYSPSARLLVVGAVHITQALAPMAALAGLDVTVIDPRSAFASRERFPGVTLCAEWPDQAMAELKPDVMTAVVTLTHDPKLDDPALVAALDSPAFYVGALGSRRTHAKRLERLRERGIDDDALARIHSPIGLDLGGRLPAEIAVSILAEVVQTRYRRPA